MGKTLHEVLVTLDSERKSKIEQRIKQMFVEENTHISQRLYRTLIRYNSMDTAYVYVMIPGWNATTLVPVPINEVPVEIIEQFKTNNIRCHASVNLGADTVEEIKITNWKTDD